MSSMDELIAVMPGECWAVRGSDSRGGYWFSRRIPGMVPGTDTLDQAEAWAKETAARMNSMGASVQPIKQRLNRETLVGTWEDVIEA